MTNFEKITETPEALGEFFAALPVATGPWDENLHRAFCDSCELLECKTEACPYKGNRLPWWLMLGTEAENHGPVENPEDGKCMEFNVYLGRKNQGGIQLRGVEKVIFPTMCAYNMFLPVRAELKLIFRSMEYADAVIRALDEMCTIEIRAAVRNFSPLGSPEFHGNYYILEAAPKEIVAEPLTRRGGMGVEVHFKVRRFTANDTDGNERWSIEWTGLEAKMGKG